MIVIKMYTRNSRLWRYTSGVITEGADLKFEFIFKTEDWQTATTKTAVFNYKGKTYEATLDGYNQCYVPSEVIYDPYFKVSLYGGEIHTNTVTIPVEGKSSDTPNKPDIDDDPTSNAVNILDGGAIIFDLNDDPNEDDDSNSSDENGVVDYIEKNNIPFYIGVVGNEYSVVEYKQLNMSSANYTDQCFYTAINNDNKVVNAGYQITFKPNDENIAQSFLVCSIAKITTAYQYQPAFNQWIDMGFDGTYWVEIGTTTKVINGKEIIFTIYAYNVELMGDAITAPEYWRFEVEVL